MSQTPSRLLHTMIRVGDLDRSVAWYEQMLGMKELRRNDVPAGKYTLAFMGFAGNAAGESELELTYNYGTESYEMGNAFGHLAVSMPDVAAACARIRDAGGTVTRDAGPVKHGTTIIAFVRDPDGYLIELIQR